MLQREVPQYHYSSNELIFKPNEMRYFI